MLKRYNLASSEHAAGDYLIALVDTDVGILAVISDWGNYAYQWTHPGKEFRAFLAGLSADYLCTKLTHGRRDAKVFDEESTKTALLRALAEHNQASIENTGLPWRNLEQEREALMAYDMDSFESYMAWQAESLLPQADEYGQTMPNPDAMDFCTKVWPRFKALLETEIAQEVSDLKGLKEARPVLKLAVETEIKELTKGKT